MSSPKDFISPPKYSMKAFNGSLNEVFQLQTMLRSQLNFIQNLCVDDKELGIQFDCKEKTGKIKFTEKEILKPLVFNYKGTFNQSIYNLIENELLLRLNSLNRLKETLDTIQQDFNNKRNDYESYIEYLKYNLNSKISFNDFKQEITNYYKNLVKDVDKNIIEETVSKIEEIQYINPNDKFQFGFKNLFEEKKEDIIYYTKKKESEINTIRNKVSDQIIKVSGVITFEKKKSKEIIEIENKINLIVDNCNDIEYKREFHKKLKSLSESESLKEVFYYKELFDSIFIIEKNRKIKQELKSLLINLNKTTIHEKFIEKKSLLTNKINESIDADKVSDTLFENFKRNFESLKLENIKLIEEEGVLEKERLFLKSQMITNLENMGYEVMNDLEVIDFEKSNDFLLKVKGQDNYINLLFREDGSMKYNFQIPENKNNLSVDEVNLKLQEMKLTCDDFNQSVSDLKKMGVELKLKSESEISEKTLMSFTKKTKERLKDKMKSEGSKITQNQNTKQRYLNE